MRTEVPGSVDAHYGRGGLAEAIEDGLRAAGVDPAGPSIEDLAPVDQFHIGGKGATLELATWPGPTGRPGRGPRGRAWGPARTLAAAFGCRVAVLDLTEEFFRVGRLLTARGTPAW